MGCELSTKLANWTKAAFKSTNEIRVWCVCCREKREEKYADVVPRLLRLLNIVSEKTFHRQAQDFISVGGVGFLMNLEYMRNFSVILMCQSYKLR